MTILLWEKEAPYADGKTTEDRPHLVPYIVNDNENHAAVVICPGVDIFDVLIMKVNLLPNG